MSVEKPVRTVILGILAIFGIFPIIFLIMGEVVKYAKKRSAARRAKLKAIRDTKKYLKFLTLFLQSMQERKDQIPNFNPELLQLLPD